MRRLMMIAAAVTALAMSSGCQTEGGMGYSSDSFTFISRAWEPKTVSVVDTRTGETIWSIDLPVGKQLNVKFKRGAGPNEYYPDEIQWQVVEAGRRSISTNNNTLPCPPSDARRLEWVKRATPEMPGAEAASAE